MNKQDMLQNLKLCNTLEVAVDYFGKDNQLMMLAEELAELIQAISKYKRNPSNIDSLIEEVADVEIMLEQLRIIFRKEKKKIDFGISKVKQQKTERLRQLLLSNLKESDK